MNTNALQALMDSWSAEWQRERAMTQLTLGQLITMLETLPPDKLVVGFGKPHSYRGYYRDLAFEPTEVTITVADLLMVACGCMGRIFEGYKGGDYLMGETTPLWLSFYGDASSQRIMGLNTDGEIIWPVLAEEEA